MGVIGIRVPSELFERYKSLPSEERIKIYKTIQGFVIALLSGEVKDAGQAVYNISVNICSERSKGSVKDAEKLYITVVEALKLLRELSLKNASLAKIVKELRRILAAIALQAVDKHVEKHLKDIQKSFRKLVEMYINKENDEEAKQVLKELEQQLFKLYNHLVEKYPVF